MCHFDPLTRPQCITSMKFRLCQTLLVEDLLPGVLQTGAVGVSKPSSGQGSINQGASNVIETNEKIFQQLAVLQDECAFQSSLHQIFLPSHGDV